MGRTVAKWVRRAKWPRPRRPERRYEISDPLLGSWLWFQLIAGLPPGRTATQDAAGLSQ